MTGGLVGGRFSCQKLPCRYTAKNPIQAEETPAVEHQIDLKALLVEKPDCDAGIVQQLRTALGQGGTQYRALRDVTEILKKKLEGAPPAQAKVWHLKLGIASFFLG